MIESMTFEKFKSEINDVLDSNFKIMSDLLDKECIYRKILTEYMDEDAFDGDKIKDVFAEYLVRLLSLVLSIVNHIHHYDFMNSVMDEKKPQDRQRIFTVFDLFKYATIVHKIDDFFEKAIYEDIMKKFISSNHNILNIVAK